MRIIIDVKENPDGKLEGGYMALNNALGRHLIDPNNPIPVAMVANGTCSNQLVHGGTAGGCGTSSNTISCTNDKGLCNGSKNPAKCLNLVTVGNNGFFVSPSL